MTSVTAAPTPLAAGPDGDSGGALPASAGEPPRRSTPARAADVLELVERHDVEIVRFLWVDHNGIVRGKGVSRESLPGRLRSGVPLSVGRQAASLLDQAQPVPGFAVMDEVRIAGDPGTLALLPHAPGSAALLGDLLTRDGTPWGACPRAFLRDAMADAAREGYAVVAAFEPEFTLLRDGAPLDDGLTLDNEAFDVTNDYVIALVRALRSAGVAVEQYHPETSPGQHEVTIRPAPALRAADNHVWQRMITRGLARRRGLHATFAPVPLAGLRGNGNHLHVSLWRDGNAFAAPGGGLSDVAHHFIAGVLAHLPGLSALLCAGVNSYTRLMRGKWAGAYGCYGFDNREAAVRVPSVLGGDESGTTNVEIKPCDGTANPYLALGAVIHAGLDGVRRRLDPGPPLTVDPNTLTDAELRRRGVTTLPGSLAEAVDALERDDLLMSVLGSPRRELYTAIKRADVRDLAALPESEAYAVYHTRF
ncbi:glutamine synthetase family protein [Micromonospora sediminicola]|uniref:glutamine synthetase family protein n=1 Tax=Micromonospora sediminicola TaxID=946078 RepID=UPI0033BA027A